MASPCSECVADLAGNEIMVRIGLLLLLGLSACSPAGVVVGAGATVGVGAAQDRGLRVAVSDTEIQTQINARWAGESLSMFNQLGTMVHEGRVLVTGRVDHDAIRTKALELASLVQGVVQVIDEVQVGPANRTVDYGRDLWIIGQLRSKLTFDGAVSAVNYAIDSVGGVVYLMGIAQSQAELDRVIAHARNQSYVRRVVSHVRVKDQTAPNLAPGSTSAGSTGGAPTTGQPELPSAPAPSNRRDAVSITPL
jgi:osmotically-inducible protein OsmY